MSTIPRSQINPQDKQSKTGGTKVNATLTDVLREYWRAMRDHKWLGILFVCAAAGAALVGSVITPLFYKKFFDLLAIGISSPADALPGLLNVLFIVLGLNILSFILWRGSAVADSYFAVKVAVNLRMNAFEYLVNHSYRFFSNQFTGGLTQRITRFTNSFNRVSDRLAYEVIPTMLSVVGIMIVLYFTNKILALAVFIWMILLFAFSWLAAKWKLKYSLLTSEADSRIGATLSDSISNHTTTQLFSGFRHEIERLRLVVLDHARLWLTRWNIDSITDAAQQVLGIAIEFVVFYITLKYWGAGGVTIGVFVLLQAYIIRLNNNLWNSSRIIRDLYEAFADAKEMVDIMKTPQEIMDLPNAQMLRVENGGIVMKDVRFAFTATASGNDNHVLGNETAGINLSVAPGERVAFIGPSGAGKSTLVRLLLRLYDVKSGSILIDGQDIRRVSQNSLRNAISFVPQDPILFHRTLKENIRYGKFDATDDEIIAASKLAHCHEFISGFPLGYDTLVGERGVKLSGGERQRVAIARAILKNAPILILDEATSSLDSHSEALIQDALDNLMKGKTVIVIAHRLSTIRMMDRIVVIDHGAVIEEGNHAQLVRKKGMYAKLWSLQSGGFIKEDSTEDSAEQGGGTEK